MKNVLLGRIYQLRCDVQILGGESWPKYIIPVQSNVSGYYNFYDLRYSKEVHIGLKASEILEWYKLVNR